MNTATLPSHPGAVRGACASQPAWKLTPGSNPPWPAPVRRSAVVLRGKYCSITLGAEMLAPMKLHASLARSSL